MNEIQRLIREMCPDGVPMVALGEICTLLGGGTPSKSHPEYYEGNIPWATVSDMNCKIINDTILHINDLAIKESATNLIHKNNVIISTHVGVGKVCWLSKDTAINQDLKAVLPKDDDVVDKWFLFYWFESEADYFLNNARGGTVKGVTVDFVLQTQIPLPPLPIQQRIVEILDKFTSLVSSLDSEIALRQKQYEYYRNKLLSFEEGVPMVALGDIASVYDGTHQTPKYSSKGIKFVSVENIDDIYTSDKYITKEDFAKNYKNKPQVGDILMTRIGSVGRCAIVDREEPIAFYVSLSLIRPCDKIINKYLKYIIESRHGEKELRKRTLLTAVPLKINLNDVGKILIPIPPLPLQQHIVRTLDTFESLLTNLKKERELRQKQYEYYREKLLTFA